MTNLEKIRYLSVEEMKDFILILLSDCYNCYFCPAKNKCYEDMRNKCCDDVIRKWLESEVEE